MRVCFDTNAWSAVLNEEEDKDLYSLSRWFTKVENGDAVLIVPAIVTTEIGAHSDQAKVHSFSQSILQPNIECVDISHTLGLEAGVLRRRARTELSLKLKTPDALVLATAERFRANVLISTDSDLLRLEGHLGLNVQIGEPSTGLDDQPLLDDQL